MRIRIHNTPEVRRALLDYNIPQDEVTAMLGKVVELLNPRRVAGFGEYWEAFAWYMPPSFVKPLGVNVWEIYQ